MLCQTKLTRRGSHQQAEEKKQVVYGVLCIGQKVQLNFFFLLVQNLIVMEEMQKKVFVLAQSCPFWEGVFCFQVTEHLTDCSSDSA